MTPSPHSFARSPQQPQRQQPEAEYKKDKKTADPGSLNPGPAAFVCQMAKG